LDPDSFHVGFVVDKVALGKVFPPSTLVFFCQFHSICSPLFGKGQKIIIIIITGLHNKPYGCGALVASVTELFCTKKEARAADTDILMCSSRFLHGTA
jgi:hypothetical protein